MSSDWLFAAEFVLTAVLVLGFAAHQLRSLKKLKEERERKAREAAARGDAPKP
ncbi:hypothetical protein [Phreatobacter sp.]|uniref:hypothetical protein n=1 Tax=Phreatobacter sp. TaxID=1966341 RepID=UPI0022C6393B|nr:hypothetical protein [Phreatobacter sp.]MCZ8315465.1 hypothetical protein [Phreatobacter sp.]